MTKEATSGLGNSREFTRRRFLQNTAGITFAVSAGGIITACSDDDLLTQRTDAASSAAPNIWVSINVDNTIVIRYAGTEMGQGSMTHAPLILAEFLDADWDRVEVDIVREHDTRYGNPFFQYNLYTAGSTQIMVYFDILAAAGSQARKWLMSAVANAWTVPLEELSTQPQRVVHANSDREISFGDIVATLPMPEQIPDVDASDRKSAADYRYLGKQVMRRDIPAKGNGSEIYGIDIQVPGMAYAAVLRCPVEGDGPLSVDDAAAKAIEGVTDVVTLPYGVAVVGNSVEATHRGKRALNVTWTTDSPFRERDLDTALKDYAETASDLSIDGVAWSVTGESKKTLESADDVVEALYTSDPAYHAQMEPLNATASVSDDGKSAEIWVGTQTQSLTIIGAAEALDTEQKNITLHPLTMGGGFGRRSVLRQQYVDDALFISRDQKRPIKVIWSREDDLEAGQFRAPAAQFLRASFDDDGALAALHHRVAVPNHLPTMNKHRWEVSKPKDVISMLGSENTTYDIPNHLAEHLATERPCRVVAWRGVATSYTKFAMESFIDELADHRAVDPLEFRLQLCHKNPRMHKVLETVADMAGWGGSVDDGRALGIAVSGYARSLSAGIADISVDRASGIITVHNYYGVGDAGFIVSPRNARAQVIGSIVFGLSSSLTERITIKDGAVQETNFHQYRIMRMNEMPNIEVRIPSTDNPPSGVGELGLAMVGPSIANALFRLTGKRVRHLPLTAAVVSAALDS